ncbi:MAG: hypothetical protein KC548_02940 [Nanoarchaeota archaeon]|nr:hypothetical protein [Nanoarchaeota archaeon]
MEMKLVIRFFVFFFGFFFFVMLMSACSCIQSETSEGYALADLVVEAKVTAVKEQSFSSFLLVETVVDKVYKGESSKLQNFKTHESSATCGYPVHVGDVLLIYAQRNEDSDYVISLCSGTKPLLSADDGELVFLGGGELVGEEKEAKVFGSLQSFIIGFFLAVGVGIYLNFSLKTHARKLEKHNQEETEKKKKS